MGKKNSIRLGLVQMKPKLGRPSENLNAMARWAAQAKRKKVDLLLFPELAVTGYVLKDLVPEVALQPGHKALACLARASKGMAIVAGFVEESRDGQFFNSAICYEGGKAVGIHRKVYLPTYGLFDERRDLSPGDRFRVVSTKLGRLGVLLCEDAWHPSSASVLALQNLDGFLILSSSPARGFRGGQKRAQSVESWCLFGRALAAFFRCPVAYCNRTGVEEGLAFSGGSFVADEEGEIKAGPLSRKEGLFVHDFPLGRARASRRGWPLLRDERPRLVLSEYRALLEAQDREEAGP